MGLRISGKRAPILENFTDIAALVRQRSPVLRETDLPYTKVNVNLLSSEEIKTEQPIYPGAGRQRVAQNRKSGAFLM